MSGNKKQRGGSFFAAVEKMREAQRTAVRTNGRGDKAAAKRAEAKVDLLIKDIRDIWARDEQPELADIEGAKK